MLDLYSIFRYDKSLIYFFVSLSISDLKLNVEILSNFPFWEETQSTICFCRLAVNEKVFFLSLLLQMLSEQRLQSR